MNPNKRACSGPEDFPAISDFLFSLYQKENQDGNWLQPIWEYAYTHPWFDEAAVPRIAIWEAHESIVAVTLFEHRLGEAFFQTHSDFDHLKPEMIEHAEQYLVDSNEQSDRALKAYVKDDDLDFEQLIRSRGYQRQPEADRPMSQFVIPTPFPSIITPDGFKLMSLADENDLVRIDRVLWRGFNHPGEPPEDSIEGRRKMQSGPHYRKDLTIVVEAPSGDYAAFSGLWFDPINRIGYVEPVATDPDYRRMGLGSAAVMEGIRRCGELGASVAYVGSDLPFYQAMGFRKLFTHNCWVKIFQGDQHLSHRDHHVGKKMDNQEIK